MSVNFKVTKGARSLTVYPWTHPNTGRDCWRFAWADATGATRYTTRRDQGKARLAALDRLAEIEKRAFKWTSLSKGRRAFLTALHALCHPEDEPALLKLAQALAKARSAAEPS